jgi:hypothetical protein
VSDRLRAGGAEERWCRSVSAREWEGWLAARAWQGKKAGVERGRFGRRKLEKAEGSEGEMGAPGLGGVLSTHGVDKNS